MIVCICNALCERRCREAAQDPECRTVGCVYRRLGCRVRCGKCVPSMQDLLSTTKMAEPGTPPQATPTAADLTS